MNKITQDNFIYKILCVIILILILLNINYFYKSIISDDVSTHTMNNKIIIKEGLSIKSLGRGIKKMIKGIKKMTIAMSKLATLPIKMIKLMRKSIKMIRLLNKFFKMFQNFPRYLYKLVKNTFSTLINTFKINLVKKIKYSVISPIEMLFTSIIGLFSGIKYIIFSTFINIANSPKCIMLYILNIFNPNIKTCIKQKSTGTKIDNVRNDFTSGFDSFYKNFGNI